MTATATIRKGTAQAHTARALNAGRTIARSTLDATVLVEGVDAQVIRCRAKEGFTKGRVTVEAGQQFFLVRSSKFANRYYVVAWDAQRLSWQCSCYCVCSRGEHVLIVNEWVLGHVVAPKREQDPVSAKVAACVQGLREQAKALNDTPNPRTKEEWRRATANQKAADRAYREKCLQEARSLRESA